MVLFAWKIKNHNLYRIILRIWKKIRSKTKENKLNRSKMKENKLNRSKMKENNLEKSIEWFNTTFSFILKINFMNYEQWLFKYCEHAGIISQRCWMYVLKRCYNIYSIGYLHKWTLKLLHEAFLNTNPAFYYLDFQIALSEHYNIGSPSLVLNLFTSRNTCQTNTHPKIEHTTIRYPEAPAHAHTYT